MREIKALSPTSVILYGRDPISWYLRYCAEPRLPYTEQGRPAAAGSAFDAVVKSTLYAQFHPNEKLTPEHPYSATQLIAKQVDAANREWATRAGIHCLDQYSQSGALTELLLSVTALPEIPKFEFRTREKIVLNGLEVPILGIPDMSYHFGELSTLAVLDWKVNGFCSKSATSPQQGYLVCRDGWRYDMFPPSRSANKMHKDARPVTYRETRISEQPLEEINEDWATQLATYAWLLGEPPGSNEYICAIEQVCGSPIGTEFPNLRIASFRNRISRGFQETLIGKYANCWHAYTTGHIFLTETFDASVELCGFLNKICETLMQADPASVEWEAAINYISGRNNYDLYHDYRVDILKARGLTELATPAEAIRAGSGLINLAAATTK